MIRWLLYHCPDLAWRWFHVQVERCQKCKKLDYARPAHGFKSGGHFWGPWFYCRVHDAEMNACYELYQQTSQGDDTCKNTDLALK